MSINNSESPYTWIVTCIGIAFLIRNLISALKPTTYKYKNMFRHKVILITGASSGIGEAAAHKFAGLGCKVILTARRIDELQRVKNEILNSDSKTLHEPIIEKLDLDDSESIPKIAKNLLEKVGKVDILINNAGISFRGTVIDTPLEVYKRVFSTNFFGQIALTKAILPSMIENKSGHIVFISSFQGKYTLPYRTAYGASKHALQAFGEGLRIEVNKHNIGVSMIFPPYVNTGLSVNAITSSGEKYGVLDKNTKNGASPSVVAEDIITAVKNNKKEFKRLPFYGHFYHYTKTFCPPLYFKILQIMYDWNTNNTNLSKL